MASYEELHSIATDELLLKKIAIALCISADDQRAKTAEPNYAARIAWAEEVLEAPNQKARVAIWDLLAQNKDAPKQTILDVLDETIQNNIDIAVEAKLSTLV